MWLPKEKRIEVARNVKFTDAELTPSKIENYEEFLNLKETDPESIDIEVQPKCTSPELNEKPFCTPMSEIIHEDETDANEQKLQYEIVDDPVWSEPGSRDNLENCSITPN